VTGRSSRFAKILDRRVSLDDVEEWLESGNGASPVAAVAVAGGTTVTAFTTGEPTVLEPVRQEIIAALTVPTFTIAVRHLAALPRTANGKVDYSQLEQLAERRCPA
jgi:acyl-coenzyme A synthetase/AMP-(fatty) acid ligase